MAPISLRCDNCGAPLRPSANLPTVECEHCGRVVLLAPAAAVRARSRAGVLGASVLGLCAVAAIALAARGGAAKPAVNSSTTTVVSSTRISTSSSITVTVEAPKPDGK
jgi:hypothetical protein